MKYACISIFEEMELAIFVESGTCTENWNTEWSSCAYSPELVQHYRKVSYYRCLYQCPRSDGYVKYNNDVDGWMHACMVGYDSRYPILSGTSINEQGDNKTCTLVYNLTEYHFHEMILIFTHHGSMMSRTLWAETTQMGLTQGYTDEFVWCSSDESGRSDRSLSWYQLLFVMMENTHTRHRSGMSHQAVKSAADHDVPDIDITVITSWSTSRKQKAWVSNQQWEFPAILSYFKWLTCKNASPWWTKALSDKVGLM